jgi:SAM-dependent methyltransferase
MQKLLQTLSEKADQLVRKLSASLSRPKTSKPKKTGITDEEGHDFGQIQWNEKQLQNLLLGLERKELWPMIPNLKEKWTLSVNPAMQDHLDLLKKKGGEKIFKLDVNRRPEKVPPAEQEAGPEIPTVRGTIQQLPFTAITFHLLFFPSALAWRGDLEEMIPEANRCLKDNGRIVVSIIHPFFEYLMNPKGGFKKNIGSLFQTLRKNGFLVEDLREGSLDDGLKTVTFPQKLLQDLRRFQKLPLVLILRAIKLPRKG